MPDLSYTWAGTTLLLCVLVFPGASLASSICVNPEGVFDFSDSCAAPCDVEFPDLEEAFDWAVNTGEEQQSICVYTSSIPLVSPLSLETAQPGWPADMVIEFIGPGVGYCPVELGPAGEAAIEIHGDPAAGVHLRIKGLKIEQGLCPGELKRLFYADGAILSVSDSSFLGLPGPLFSYSNLGAEGLYVSDVRIEGGVGAVVEGTGGLTFRGEISSRDAGDSPILNVDNPFTPTTITGGVFGNIGVGARIGRWPRHGW